MPQEMNSSVPPVGDTPTPTPVDIRSLVEAARRMPRQANIAQLASVAPAFFVPDVVAPERLMEAGHKLYGASASKSAAESLGALLTGVAHLRLGQKQEAAEFLAIAAYHPKIRRALLQQADALHTQPEAAAQTLLLGQAIAKGAPDFGHDASRGHYYAGVAHTQLGNFVGAKSAFYQAAIDRTGVVCGHMLSMAEVLAERMEKNAPLVTLYAEAVFSQSKNPKAALLAGQGYATMGNTRESNRLLGFALRDENLEMAVGIVNPQLLSKEKFGTLDLPRARQFRIEQQLLAQQAQRERQEEKISQPIVA